VSKFVIKDSPCFIGLNKNEAALRAKIDEIIDKAKASGELTKISEKWLKAPLPATI
jgi:polar amino acid transport system substrate-binding protein